MYSSHLRVQVDYDGNLVDVKPPKAHFKSRRDSPEYHEVKGILECSTDEPRERVHVVVGNVPEA